MVAFYCDPMSSQCQATSYRDHDGNLAFYDSLLLFDCVLVLWWSAPCHLPSIYHRLLSCTGMEQVEGDEPITQTESELPDMVWRLVSEKFADLTRNHEAVRGLRKVHCHICVPLDSCQFYEVSLRRRFLSLTALQVSQSRANSVGFQSYWM